MYRYIQSDADKSVFHSPHPQNKEELLSFLCTGRRKNSKDKGLKEKERAGKRGKERKSQRILKRGSV